MSAYKIVGRYSDRVPRWSYSGKIGTQAKKRVYTTRKDFERYAPETMERWTKFCGYDVESYKMVDEKWVKLEELK